MLEKAVDCGVRKPAQTNSLPPSPRVMGRNSLESGSHFAAFITVFTAQLLPHQDLEHVEITAHAWSMMVPENLHALGGERGL